MLHLHKTKKGTFYATLTRKGKLVWETPKMQYKTRRGALNAMFSGLDGFGDAGDGQVAMAFEILYRDHTGKEPENKIAKRRKR